MNFEVIACACSEWEWRTGGETSLRKERRSSTVKSALVQIALLQKCNEQRNNKQFSNTLNFQTTSTKSCRV